MSGLPEKPWVDSLLAVVSWEPDGQVGSRFVYGRLQGGQVFLDDIPDQIEVDAKILVSQDVSGACDLRPGNGWLLGA